MICFDFINTTYDCCEDPYVPTQRDHVHQCIRQELLALSRGAHNSSNALLDAGMDPEHHLDQVVDTQILLDWLKDRWNTLEEASNAGTLDMQAVWDDLPIDCIARYFRCEYGVNIYRSVHMAGLYDPSNPVPGTDIPSPGVA